MKKTLKITIFILTCFCLTACQNKQITPAELPAFTPMPTRILITPDPQEIPKVTEAVMLKYKAWETGNWDAFYEILHSDSKKLISKENFIQYWNIKRNSFPIKNPQIRDINFFQSMKHPDFNKTYTNVAEVVVNYNQQIADKPITTHDGMNFLTKENNQWKILWKAS